MPTTSAYCSVALIMLYSVRWWLQALLNLGSSTSLPRIRRTRIDLHALKNKDFAIRYAAEEW